MSVVNFSSEDDVIIGQASQEECHSNSQLLHQAVHFTLLDPSKRKVLIARQSANGGFGSGKWCFPGKHVLGRDYANAVFRAVEDDLGFSSKGGCGEYANHIFSYDSQQEFVRFFIVYWEGEIVKLNRAKFADYKWVTLNELKAAAEEESFSKLTKYWVENIDWWNSLQGWFVKTRD